MVPTNSAKGVSADNNLLSNLYNLASDSNPCAGHSLDLANWTPTNAGEFAGIGIFLLVLIAILYTLAVLDRVEPDTSTPLMHSKFAVAEKSEIPRRDHEAVRSKKDGIAMLWRLLGRNATRQEHADDLEALCPSVLEGQRGKSCST